MNTALKVGAFTVVLFAFPLATQAGKTEGIAIGAGAGALVAGPIGAVVGGVMGYRMGGPNVVTPPHRRCWHDDWGRRHCMWRRR